MDGWIDRLIDWLIADLMNEFTWLLSSLIAGLMRWSIASCAYSLFVVTSRASFLPSIVFRWFWWYVHASHYWNKQFYILVHRTCLLRGSVRPFWHPRTPFRHLGGILVEPWDRLGGPWERQDGHKLVETGFASIWEWFWDPGILVFYVQEVWKFIFSDLFPGHLSFYRLLSRSFDAGDSEI